MNLARRLSSLLAPSVALVALVATGCDNTQRQYDGDRALGLFALTDGSFLVAIAEVYDKRCGDKRCDVVEDLYLEKHKADGSLEFRTKLLAAQPPFGRAMMKRLATGQLLVSTANLQTLFYVSTDGLTTNAFDVPGVAVSRMKDNNDWLVGGTGSDKRVHRYRVADGGDRTPETDSDFQGKPHNTFGDVRATGDGGVAAVVNSTDTTEPPQRLLKFGSDGKQAFSFTPTSGELGQLLNQAGDSLRILNYTSTTTKVLTVGAAGQLVGELDLTQILPKRIWPVDNNGIAAVDGSGARLLDQAGNATWTLAGSFGTAPDIFSNGMRTLVAGSTSPTGAVGGEVTITDIDAAGSVTGTHPITKDQKRTIPD